MVFFPPFLSQGGAFYFMEHVADKPSTWNYFWQQVLDPVWHLLFDGCNLTRESWKALGGGLGFPASKKGRGYSWERRRSFLGLWGHEVEDLSFVLATYYLCDLQQVTHML